MKATNIRKGQLLLVDGELCRVMSMAHVTPGKGRAHVQAKLRKLKDGTQKDMRFRSTDDVERAVLESKQMQYLYSDGDSYHFMDVKSYEQVELGSDVLGDGVNYLLPDTMIGVETFNGQPVGVELPPVVDLKVVDTMPGIKDSTAQAQRKPATLETGVVVQVPAFIEPGEVIRVNTIDGSYSERAK